VRVADRPVSETGAGNRTEHAALVEIDRVKPPEVGGVVQAGAADRASVPQRGLERLQLRLLRFVVAKRLRVLDDVVGDAAEIPVLQLVGAEVPQRNPRALLQDDARQPAPSELTRDDTASRARTNHDEVDGLGLLEGLAGHLLCTGSTTNPGYSRS